MHFFVNYDKEKSFLVVVVVVVIIVVAVVVVIVVVVDVFVCSFTKIPTSLEAGNTLYKWEGSDYGWSRENRAHLSKQKKISVLFRTT